MFEHVLGTAPKKVAIVGCGPSMQDYVNIMASAQSQEFHTDEVWGINAAGAAINVDLNFVMDDIALMRAAGLDIYDKVKGPVITSVARRDEDKNYPLAEVLNIPGAKDYLNHTAAYMIAYAVLIGVKEIYVFGCDYISAAKVYTHSGEGADLAPRYMACMAYWIGVAAAQGVTVVPTPTSPLLDSDKGVRDKFYGYAIPPVVKREGA